MSTLAAARVHGSPVKVGTVIGFPLGANLTVIKLAEAEAAAQNGAHELDMVINIGALKSGDRVLVQTEMRSLAELAHAHGAILQSHHRNCAAEPGGEDPRLRSGARSREWTSSRPLLALLLPVRPPPMLRSCAAWLGMRSA